MSFDWYGYFDDIRRRKPTDWIRAATGPGAYDYIYDHSHGSTRRWLAEVPFYGWYRKIRDEAQSAQDYYDNTGEDPLYMSRYGTNAGTVSGIAGPISRVPRMARSLSALYPAEIKEDLNARTEMYRMKRDSFRASEHAADAWGRAWSTRYGRD